MKRRIGQKRQIKQCHSDASISSPGAIETIRRDSVKSCPPRIIAAICFSRNGRSAARSANGPIRRLRAKASAASRARASIAGASAAASSSPMPTWRSAPCDPALAQAPARHRRGPGLPERAIVDITELGHFLGQGCGVRRVTFPAAFADLARQICRQSGTSRREPFDIAQGDAFEPRSVERRRAPVARCPVSAHAPSLCHSRNGF